MTTTRQARLLAAMDEASLDAAAFVPGPNLYFLTGASLHLMERPTLLLVTREGARHAVMPLLERTLWESLAPYVLKKGTTLAVESIVYERQDWVLALLANWSSVSAKLDASALDTPTGPKRPLLGMVLEGEHLLNKVQILAISAAQKEAAARGESAPFGEVAVRMGLLRREQLEYVLAIQGEIAVALDSPKRLGFYLIEAGVITPTKLHEALKEQRASGMPLGQVLVQRGSIDQSLLDTMLQIQRMERISTYSQDLAV